MRRRCVDLKKMNLQWIPSTHRPIGCLHCVVMTCIALLLYQDRFWLPQPQEEDPSWLRRSLLWPSHHERYLGSLWMWRRAKQGFLCLSSRRRALLFHHHCSHTSTEAGISVCLPPCSVLLLLLLAFPSFAHALLFFSLSAIAVHCLPPSSVGCSTGAGWRHSGLILLLLMLMFKRSKRHLLFLLLPHLHAARQRYINRPGFFERGGGGLAHQSAKENTPSQNCGCYATAAN